MLALPSSLSLSLVVAVVDALEPEITRDTRKREAEDPHLSVDSFHKSLEKNESALFAVPDVTPSSRCLIKCKRARRKLPYIIRLPAALLLRLRRLLDVCSHRSFSSLFISSIRNDEARWKRNTAFSCALSLSSSRSDDDVRCRRTQRLFAPIQWNLDGEFPPGHITRVLVHHHLSLRSDVSYRPVREHLRHRRDHQMPAHANANQSFPSQSRRVGSAGHVDLLTAHGLSSLRQALDLRRVPLPHRSVHSR